MTKNSKKKQAAVAKAAQQIMMAKANAKRRQKKKRTTTAIMGPVSAISTAPVAVGNSVRGSRSISRQIPGGIVVSGRDFMFTPIGSGSVTTWTMVGGTPLTPVAFGDSSIRNYMQLYQKYRWKRCVVYYITSSPTSANGDVMFYYSKNRESVFLNQTSSFLLPYVLSDPSTVIGPQWTNHAADLKITGTWKSTDYGMDTALQEFADGEVFLLSKTSTTDSPGYVLFDYVIEFADMQISPRLLNLPLPRAQYSNVALTTSGAKSQSAGVEFVVNVGTNLTGGTSAVPNGFTAGDIYKVILDVTNSIFTTGTAANLVQLYTGNSNNQAVTLSDGFTCYGAADTATTLILYPTIEAAAATGGSLQWGASLTYNVNVQAWVSLCGSVTTLNLIPKY